MKREARLLLQRATDSLLLAIEHFNRPWDRGRATAVLVHLDHSFEMLLKAAIVHKGGRIREKRAKETIGFDHCVRKCLSDAQVKCLTPDQALPLRIVNNLRDAATHYILNISEQQLYLHAQAGVTVFQDILRGVFDKSVADYLPERVLPVSTSPPTDLNTMLDEEFRQIRMLLAPRSRRRTEAMGRLRPWAIMENSITKEGGQPGERDLNRLLKQVEAAEPPGTVLPGVASLRLDTEGSGITFNIRFSKKEGIPIRPPEAGEQATIVATRRVNELGFYNLGLKQLAENVNTTPPKCLALVKHLGLQDSEDYFKPITIGKTTFKRYSQKALARLREELPNMNVQAVWERHKPVRRRSRLTAEVTQSDSAIE